MVAMLKDTEEHDKALWPEIAPFSWLFFKPTHFPYRKEKGCRTVRSERSGANELGKVLQEAELGEALPLVQKNLFICLPSGSLLRYLSARF